MSILMKTMLALIGGILLMACVTSTATSVSPDTRISMQRTACFGACPIYTVSITGSGEVSYNGRRFVRVTGEQHGQASSADVAHLVAMMDNAHFFSLNDAYRASVTDLPSTEITFERGGQAKTVTDYGGSMVGMPHEVSEIEAEIDRVANTAQWVAHPENAEAPAH
jgi:hypothetical protein